MFVHSLKGKDGGGGVIIMKLDGPSAGVTCVGTVSRPVRVCFRSESSRLGFLLQQAAQARATDDR